MRDTIRRFGENISANALESLVLQDDEVAECCVVAVPSSISGQEILLLVTRARQTLQPAQLFKRLQTKLPRYMHPAFVKVVAEFPKTPSGKIRKAALGELATTRDAWVSPTSLRT
jgi:crotonobetaine/carnitine-CoA ligase